jgi:hypothetical protein
MSSIATLGIKKTIELPNSHVGKNCGSQVNDQLKKKTVSNF